MKTPIDSAAAGAGATTTLLNGGPNFAKVDLWKFTLNGGGVVRWQDGKHLNPSLTFTAFGAQSTQANGTYVNGPLIKRGKISVKLGLEVAQLDISFGASSADLINGTALIPFAVGRGFDGARLSLYKALVPNLSAAITGVIIGFSGRVTSIKDISRDRFTMTVSSDPILLNQNMGPDVFQASCLNTHYDPNCTLTPTNVAGTITGSPTTNQFTCSGAAAAEPDHFFDKGTVIFTSGANNGLRRTVKTFLNASGTTSFAFGFPVAPSVGDTFNAVRGCLLNMADCTAQGNLIHFRGQPFVPPAITGAVGI